MIAPGAAVMAMIYAWGPLSGLHINPAVTLAFTGRGVFRRLGHPVLGGPARRGVAAALFLQAMFGHVSRGRELPDRPARRRMAVVRDGDRAHRDPGQDHPQHRDRARSIGHNAALAVGSTVALLGLFASPISGASMNPARSLGPDIVGNDYTGWWIYLAGPAISALSSPS